MKKYLLLLSTALFLAGLRTVQAQAQAVQPGDVAITKIEPTGVQSPMYGVTNIPSVRFVPKQWLQIEVQFNTLVDIDELTFEYTVVVNGTILTGAVTHVSIQKGRDHYSVAYVSPQTISQLLQGRPFTNSAVSLVQVRVTKQGQELAVMGWPSKVAAVPNLPRQPGLILNKLDTPFAPLFWDRYEALKSTPH